MKRGFLIALGTIGGFLVGYIAGALIASSTTDCGGECWTDLLKFALIAFPLSGAFLGCKLVARKTRRKP